MTLLRRATGWSAVLLVMALSPALGAPAAPARPETPRQPLVILELSLSPEGELPPVWRRAIETSLLTVAKETDTVLCFDGVASVDSPELDLLCANPGRQLPHLWWKARTGQAESGRLRIVVELEAGEKAPVGPAQLLLILQAEIGERTESLDRVVVEEIERTLPDLPELQRWFGSLGRRVDLAQSWPSGEKTTPPSVAAGPRAKIEIVGKEEKPAPPRTEATSFPVREGLVGGGFEVGPRGQLRITPAGVVFLSGESEQWSIQWQELAAARKDEGFWDSPYPLVLIEKDGRRRYVSRIDKKGLFLPGDPLLAAIARVRAARGGKMTDAAAGAGAEEPGPSRRGMDVQLEQGDIP